MQNYRTILLLSLLLVVSSTTSCTVSSHDSPANSASLAVLPAWNFTVFGDTRQQIGSWDATTNHYTHDNASNPIRAALVKKMVDTNPSTEFILHTGDAVVSGAEQDDWNRYFEDIAPITHNNISVYYAVGNHEYYTYAKAEGVYGSRDTSLTTFLSNVNNPGNERFYSFDYNNQVHFVVVNTEENWDGNAFQITAEQKLWLISDLESNIIDFVVVVYHRPSYSLRSSSRVADAREIRKVLEPVLVKYGVDLVFSGHDHYYYRTIRSNITYLTEGGGGADLYTNDDTSDWKDGDIYFSKYEYSTAIVANDAITVNTYSFDPLDNSTKLADSVVVNNRDKERTTSLSTTESTDTKSTNSKLSFSFSVAMLAVVVWRKIPLNRIGIHGI